MYGETSGIGTHRIVVDGGRIDGKYITSSVTATCAGDITEKAEVARSRVGRKVMPFSNTVTDDSNDGNGDDDAAAKTTRVRWASLPYQIRSSLVKFTR